MDPPLTDVKADVMAMANAFRAASDDDTRKVMTVMTNQTPEALESLKFYAVTKSWFLRAWPLLTAKQKDTLDDTAIGDDLREHIGKIQNSELILDDFKASPTSVDEKGVGPSADASSSGESNPQEYDIDQSKQNITEYYRRISKNSDTTKMRPGLVHTKDYFFLGPSAWLLVKEKFGFDGYEISRCCRKAAIGQGRIEIALLPGEESNENSGEANRNLMSNNLVSTAVPLSGRFPYEKVFEKDNNTVSFADSIINRKAAFLSEIRSNQSEEKDDSSQPLLLLPAPPTINDQEGSQDGFGPLYGASKMDVESTEDGGNNNIVPQLSGRKRLSSGLSNMGNTCFMNSTLQCLAHTETLRKYFLSGEYKKDLNRDNPLGTGGELATQFAILLAEMWGDDSNRRNVLGGTQTWKYSNSSSDAVYPRTFKNSLGKHAEQFMGYDQHDSQELATYLLDALHEDTNRVTKKPYVEKPEQEENETDADAADKAWEMHLRREDSQVLENFMGQVKSRLECCKGNCTRVSTTFDPFMYLSVPIPGENERTLEVTFVPMDPAIKMQKLSLTLVKTATIADMLQKMNEELVQKGICAQPIPLHDFAPVEVYEKEIFKWHEPHDHIDGIKEFDQTFVYELKSLEDVRNSYTEDEATAWVANDLETSRKLRTTLDIATRTELEKGDRWKDELGRFTKNKIASYRILNATRSTTEEKIEFLQKLNALLDNFYIELDKEETAGSKRTRDDAAITDGDGDGDGEGAGPVAAMDRTSPFIDVKASYDISILEFCEEKLRRFIVSLIHQEKASSREGILVQLGIRHATGPSSDYSSRNASVCNCLVLRLPGNLSVYELREELAHRLSRSLIQQTSPGESTQEESLGNGDKSGNSTMDLLRGLILCYDNKGRGSIGSATILGMLNEDDFLEETGNGDKALIALESNEREQVRVANSVNNRGRIILYLGEDQDRQVLSGEEFDSVENDNANPVQKSDPGVSILDCIENYCKKEQLEESEMWYCNQCKEHVKAWKQFHLYRTPPILIIHLKRFFFSASTHRRDKITRKIDFPLKGLDLTSLVSCYEEDAKPIYDCYAVSNHFGGLGGGHYTAYTLSDDGVWCNYDDSRVTTDIDPKEVVSEAAYVLYYRRRDLPVGEDRDIIVGSIETSPMNCEPADIRGETSDISSNNTAQPGDMDYLIDDTASNGSSKTALSHMESIDNTHHNIIPNGVEDFADDRPLQ